MTVVDVRHRPESPSGGSPRTMTAELIGSNLWTDDATTTVLGTEVFEPDSTGLVTLKLRPNSELAQTGTYYKITISRSSIIYYAVVPDVGPVQLVNILVDPATLNPIGPLLPTLFQLRSERGQLNGYPSLDGTGKVPLSQLPESAGGETPDASATVKGILKLTNHFAGTADLPEIAASILAQIAAAYVKPGGGIPSTDLTAAVQALLALAGTAVQPAELTAAANARGIQSYSSTGPFAATFGPCGVGVSTWLVSPAAFRRSVTAVAGNLLDWKPSAIVGAVTATSDAEFDLAAINNTDPVNPVILRCLSSGTNTPLANGAGGLYCWANNSRRLPAVEDWEVQAGDIVGGTVTLALLYKNTGSGLSIGHGTVYPNRVTLTNKGSVPS